MKKITLLMIATLLLSTLAPFGKTIMAQSNVNVVLDKESINIEGDYDFKVLVNEPDYSKIEIKHKETGKVEYIESIKEDGEYSYIATVENEVYDIQSDDKNITVTNRNTRQINTLAKDIIMESLNKNVEENQLISSEWTTINSFYSSKGFDTTVVSIIAGIIASIVGGPVTGVITSIATGYASLTSPHGYFKVFQQTRSEGNAFYRRDVYHWYLYHDYTNYLGHTVSGPWRIR